MADTAPVAGRAARWTAYAPLDASLLTQLAAASRDVRDGIARHRGWRYLAVEQVKNSYRRTVLGPWWLTAQSSMYVLGLAVVFGQLLHAPLRVFLPYVAVGYLTYALASGLLRAGANVFTGHAGVIKSTRQPLSGLVLRSVTIELIQFFHNFAIVIVFFVVGLVTATGWLALSLVGLVLILVNGMAAGLWLGPTVARFRDIGPAVDSLLQVLVFFTPIFYKASDLRGSRALLVGWNPLTYLVDFFRSPLLGKAPDLATVVGAVGFTGLNVLLGIAVFSRTRSRVPYWVS